MSKFADLIRKNLNQSQKFFITIEDQIQYLEQYLQIEKLRFDNLKYEIHLSSDIYSHSELIPPMILQPIVENAIWHGRDTKLGSAHILISFLKKEADIIISVEDFGPGFYYTADKKETSNYIALSNIKQRIDLYNTKYKIECNIIIIDKTLNNIGQGTIIKIMYKSINE